MKTYKDLIKELTEALEPAPKMKAYKAEYRGTTHFYDDVPTLEHAKKQHMAYLKQQKKDGLFSKYKFTEVSND